MTDFLKNIKCRTILIISFFIYLFYVIFKINILNNYNNNKYNVVHKYVNTVKESLMNTGKNMVATKNTNIDDGNKEGEREAELKRLELKYLQIQHQDKQPQRFVYLFHHLRYPLLSALSN